MFGRRVFGTARAVFDFDCQQQFRRNGPRETAVRVGRPYLRSSSDRSVPFCSALFTAGLRPRAHSLRASFMSGQVAEQSRARRKEEGAHLAGDSNGRPKPLIDLFTSAARPQSQFCSDDCAALCGHFCGSRAGVARSNCSTSFGPSFMLYSRPAARTRNRTGAQVRPTPSAPERRTRSATSAARTAFALARNAEWPPRRRRPPSERVKAPS